MKEIKIRDPDGEPEYDGEEMTDQEYEEYRELEQDWYDWCQSFSL